MHRRRSWRPTPQASKLNEAQVWTVRSRFPLLRRMAKAISLCSNVIETSDVRLLTSFTSMRNSLTSELLESVSCSLLQEMIADCALQFDRGPSKISDESESKHAHSYLATISAMT